MHRKGQRIVVYFEKISQILMVAITKDKLHTRILIFLTIDFYYISFETLINKE